MLIFASGPPLLILPASSFGLLRIMPSIFVSAAQGGDDLGGRMEAGGAGGGWSTERSAFFPGLAMPTCQPIPAAAALPSGKNHHALLRT
jgi:hypothetical protein